jgi:hypothetical protein
MWGKLCCGAWNNREMVIGCLKRQPILMLSYITLYNFCQVKDTEFNPFHMKAFTL